jgi:hypothetical protein
MHDLGVGGGGGGGWWAFRQRVACGCLVGWQATGPGLFPHTHDSLARPPGPLTLSLLPLLLSLPSLSFSPPSLAQDELGGPQSPVPGTPMGSPTPRRLRGIEEVEGLRGLYDRLLLPPEVVAAVGNVQTLRLGKAPAGAPVGPAAPALVGPSVRSPPSPLRPQPRPPHFVSS